MLNAGHDVPLRRTVAGELISDHDAWRSHLLLQQLAQQALGSLFVASALDQDIEHDAGLVHGSPQPMLHTGNLERDLTKMPFVGLNFFSRGEQPLLAALQRPGFNIAGLRRADLLPLLGQSSPATLSRQIARLRHLAVIKRVLSTYRYYLTRAGRAAIAAVRRLTEHTIIPALA